MQRSYLNLGPALVFSLISGGALIASCGPMETTCDDGIGCVGGAGSNTAGNASSGKSGGGGAGKGGDAQGGSGAGVAGSTAGGTAGVGGAGAAGGAEGGAAGTASLPCDGACVAPTAICDEPTDTCVECLEEGDCAARANKKCDTTANACVACLESADCATAAAAKCDGGECVKCTSNDDCAHVAGKTVCDTAAGECVQCTGKDYASCGMSGGKPLVCDSATRSCSTTKEHSAGLCSPCLSDAQCGLGQLCVKEQFGTPKQDVGFFCFFQQGAALGGAPDDCTLPANRPYVAALKNQSSIDGAAATVCGLRTSTCTARNQFSAKDCSTSSAADDNKCGFAPTKDSKCLPFGASQFRCTTTCASDDDCDPDFPCDINATPKVCKIEQ